ncbi:MAG: ABC transporter permease [Acidobacteriaceae bacterium]|nr:ABC transporter permease [Acidobacteriaceae bacterium]
MRLFPKRRKPADFTAEIQSHIAIEAERLREEGLNPSDADAAALRNFGNVVRAEERFFESRRILWLEDLQKDISYTVRQLRQSPIFAITVVVTLALGIGATAAIFALTDVALIKPLPFSEAQRLVIVYERWQGELASIAPADYLDYQRQAKSFESLAAYREGPFNLGGQDRPERVQGAVVTSNFFSVLGIPAELGRTLDALHDKPGGSRNVVLSYSLWKRRYGGSPEIAGQTLLVDGEPVTIVGVMPASLTYPGNAEIWIAARFRVPEHPLRSFVDLSTSRGSHYFDVIGRLKAGLTIRYAQAELDVIARRLRQQYKNEEEGEGRALVSLRDDLVGNTRPAIFILLTAVAVLFLVACANVANIVLARGAARRKELGIRASLGAGRSRLVRQLIAEAFLLSLGGAVLGLFGAACALRSLAKLLPPAILPAAGLHVDVRLAAFATGIAIVSTVLIGLFPAIQCANVDLHNVLKEGARTFASGVRANRSRNALLVTQVALAAILLISAGLLLHSLDRLLSASQGFNPDYVLTLQLSLPPVQYKTPADRNAFATKVLERIRSLPGVRSAAVTSRLPLNPGGSRRGIEIKGRSRAPGGDISPFYVSASQDFFRTLRIPVLEGRVFSDRDTTTAPRVVIVNAAMVRHFWPGEDPIGRYIKIDQPDWTQVVGVVADVAQQSLDKAAGPAIYVPYTQDPWPNLALTIRSNMDSKSVASSAIAAIHEVDKEEPVYNVRTMDEVIASSIQVRRFRTVLLSLFAGLALALAAVGIYGVMAYAIGQRTHEIGIRLALGGQPGNIRMVLMGEGVQLAALGVIVGILASLWLTRFLQTILYGVKSTDPLAFAVTVLLLVFAALLASFIPAHRAVKRDPANILRPQ